jgi:S1-C subfamily serine protease
VETCEGEGDELVVLTGTAVRVSDGRFVTCAHCICDPSGISYSSTEAFQTSAVYKKYKVEVLQKDLARDLAVITLEIPDGELLPPGLPIYQEDFVLGMQLKIAGFPGYRAGMSHCTDDVTVSSPLTAHGVEKFVINKYIMHGNSGGPLVNAENEIVGIALEGAHDGAGVNAALAPCELRAFLSRSAE